MSEDITNLVVKSRETVRETKDKVSEVLAFHEKNSGASGGFSADLARKVHNLEEVQAKLSKTLDQLNALTASVAPSKSNTSGSGLGLGSRESEEVGRNGG